MGLFLIDLKLGILWLIKQKYEFEFSEIEIKKAENENEAPIMKLTKKRTTVKDDVETTKVLSTVLLEFDGYGFY